ncbi:hypothetical protein Tco_1114408 [Tanacetum coccineum]|uniref:Transposase n=1 Tax=Tanacetum coccineum TaxID=301880 RepID=A0ABQ5IWI6_9ASTR
MEFYKLVDNIKIVEDVDQDLNYLVSLSILVSFLYLTDFQSNVSEVSYISDEDSSEQDDDLDYVDFQIKGEENVVIPNVTTTNLFLNKLCGNNGYFRGFSDEHVPVNNNIPEVDPDESNIDARFKIKKGVSYPKFDHGLEWNKIELVLCMLVQCGRDVKVGKCAGAYIKKKVQKKLLDDTDGVVGCSDKGKKHIFTRSMKDGEDTSTDYEGSVKQKSEILDTNPSSTCMLDVEETDNGNSYFKRFYVCFKGVKDGWLEGCRKIIGLDSFFPKQTCKGELLTAMGRDANNQMYPIAWEVVNLSGVPCVDVVAGFMHLNKELDEGLDKEPILIPPNEKKTPGRKKQPDYGSFTSARGGGRGSKGVEMVQVMGEVVQVLVELVQVLVNLGADRGGSSSGRGRSTGSRGRIGGKGSNGGREIRKSLEHEHLQYLMDKKEEQMNITEMKRQEKLDKEALQQALEEEKMYERLELERQRDVKQWEHET